MRRIRFWHILLLVIGVAVLVSALGNVKGEHIARIEIGGLIISDSHRQDMLRMLAEDDNIRAVLVQVNSPGGDASASEQIYRNLRAIAAKKPVVILMGSLAASGGYIAALGGDRIFAYPTTLTGSIGVVFQWTNIEGLAKKIGIRSESVRTGALKAKPDMFSPTTPSERQYIRDLLQDTFTWFVDLVAERRNIKKSEVLKKFGSGAVFSGSRALKLKMIDEIGGEQAAREWLWQQRQIPVEMSVEEYAPNYPTGDFASFLLSKLAQAVGVQDSALQLRSKAQLQGLLLLWDVAGTR